MAEILEAFRIRARAALAFWDLPAQEPALLKFRENAVFKVRLGNGDKAALRLHRPGYHDQAALLSELQWMDALRSGGLEVPQPIATAEGHLLVELPGTPRQFADLIGWVEGAEIGETGKPLSHGPDRLARIFASLGAAMADMHTISDSWIPDAGFTRHAWAEDGLLGEAPLWGPFWNCDGMTAADRDFFSGLRLDLQSHLRALPAGLDYGLIHADLVRENVFVSGERIALIDFDDCGYGWRLFDIATALLRNRREPHYTVIKASLLDGYHSRRRLDNATIAHLPLFLLLRSLTYIGWAGQRPELPDAHERIARYVNDARELADAL